MLGPADVEREIVRLCESAEEVTRDIARLAEEAARAEVRYRTDHARALLRADGRTVAAREATALVTVEQQLLDYRIVQARLTAAQETGRMLRARLDALRSINANLRTVT